MPFVKATLLIAGMLLMAGCTDENAKVRGEFLSGCLHSGALKSLCNCVFDKLEGAYTAEELNKYARAHQPDQGFMGHVLNFSLECRTN